jgi:hypothetical protein
MDPQQGRAGCRESDCAAVEWIIANTINETARGDPDALAAHIVAALAEAGYRILPANGRENAAPRSPRPEPRQLYRSPNGDSWFLARDPATGSAFVRHQANAPSGGHVTDIELGAFLSGPRNPEHEALLRHTKHPGPSRDQFWASIIHRRPRPLASKPKLGNHSFCVTGITPV